MYVIHTHEPEIDCHQTEFILTVDIENMPNLKVQHTLIPQIEALPETLDKNVENPTPFVGFFGNSSVICVCNSETGKYEFLKSWNGNLAKNKFFQLLVTNFRHFRQRYIPQCRKEETCLGRQ